jgi:hypothetical protein
MRSVRTDIVLALSMVAEPRLSDGSAW